MVSYLESLYPKNSLQSRSPPKDKKVWFEWVYEIMEVEGWNYVGGRGLVRTNTTKVRVLLKYTVGFISITMLEFIYFFQFW